MIYLNVDMKLHSLVLKELNVKMYSSELYDDYIKVVDVTEKKQSDETRNFTSFYGFEYFSAVCVLIRLDCDFNDYMIQYFR